MSAQENRSPGVRAHTERAYICKWRSGATQGESRVFAPGWNWAEFEAQRKVASEHGLQSVQVYSIERLP